MKGTYSQDDLAPSHGADYRWLKTLGLKTAFENVTRDTAETDVASIYRSIVEAVDPEEWKRVEAEVLAVDCEMVGVRIRKRMEEEEVLRLL